MDAAPRTNLPAVSDVSPAARSGQVHDESDDAPFAVPPNLTDEALADAVDRDVADRLVRGLPVPLSRYLAVVDDRARRPLTLDAAIDGALRALAANGCTLPEAVGRVASDHPDLRRVIESTATISMLFGPSGAAHEVFEGAASERPLPSRFGKVMPDGRGRYELVEALGERRPARVFRAIDHLLSRPDAQVEVVVKILGRAGDQAQLDEAIEEARLLRALRHEAVVDLVDSGVSDDSEVYLVTEFVHGASLRDHLESRGRPTPVEAARLVASLAHAMGIAHGAGVIHCDISPANLMVDCEGRVRIVDLGSAAHVDATPALERALRGTPGFMPPEQGHPSARVAATLDVYALGAVLFWMLTGQSANGRDSAEIESLLRGRIDLRTWRSEALAAAGVPRGLARQTLGAIEIDPARRPPDAESLARRLEHWLVEEARSHLPWHERVLVWARARPRLALVLTVGGTAIVTLAIVTALLSPSEAPRRGAAYTLMAARSDRSLAYAMSRYDRSLRIDRDESRALLARIPQILGTAKAPAPTVRVWMTEPEGVRLASLLSGLQIIAGRHGEAAQIDPLVLRAALSTLLLAQGRDPEPALRSGGIDLETLLSPGDPLRSIAESVRRGAAARAIAESLRSKRSRPGWPAPEQALVDLDASIRENLVAEREVMVLLLREQRDLLAAAMAERSSRPGASVESTEGAGGPPPN